MKLVESSEVVSLRDVTAVDMGARMRLDGSEVDTLLGGGLPLGGVMFLAAAPGSGKSTLTMQWCLRMVGQGRRVRYHAGEQSPGEVAALADRLVPGWRTFQGDITVSTGQVPVPPARGESLWVIDSLQCIVDESQPGLAGSANQTKHAMDMVVRHAKQTGTPTVLIGHVTQSGSVGGTRAAQHAVDVLMTLSDERVLHCKKNRFGSIDGKVAMVMSERGMHPAKFSSLPAPPGSPPACRGT
jgi:DNA repair protein RadA/Sms